MQAYIHVSAMIPDPTMTKEKNNQKKQTKIKKKQAKRRKTTKSEKTTNNYNRNSNNNKIPTMQTSGVELFRYIEVKQMKDIPNSQLLSDGKKR